jgi:hypothetical protein
VIVVATKTGIAQLFFSKFPKCCMLQNKEKKKEDRDNGMELD